MTNTQDTKDLVRQLREAGNQVRERGYGDKSTMFDDAANAIDRLLNEREGMVLVAESEFNRLRLAAGENPI